jgi:hypothetical protein
MIQHASSSKPKAPSQHSTSALPFMHFVMPQLRCSSSLESIHQLAQCHLRLLRSRRHLRTLLTLYVPTISTYNTRLLRSHQGWRPVRRHLHSPSILIWVHLRSTRRHNVPRWSIAVVQWWWFGPCAVRAGTVGLLLLTVGLLGGIEGEVVLWCLPVLLTFRIGY